MAAEYTVKLSNDRLTAELMLASEQHELSYSGEELLELLKKEKVVFGVNREVLKQIAEKPRSFVYPITIAAGEPKVDGADSFLRSELQPDSLRDHKVFNFRSILQIPSVRKGQLLATVVPPENGTPGTDVTGRTIPAKPGRPLRIKAGNNVIFDSGRFYADCDGQVSINQQAISVNPVFEVNGDLDLRTGNIDFVGNIVIRGNVPSGYELRAGGDIRIDGLVEAAEIHAEGNIVINGGVAGAMKGRITAGGNLMANYLNQANVKAGQDIIVKLSVLHSKVTASGEVDCKAGTIIGGTISAGRNIFVKELGNELFTKTELAIGFDPLLEKAEHETINAVESAKMNIRKLTEIEAKLAEIGKRAGTLTAEQKQLLEKQQKTRQNIESSLTGLLAELEFIQYEKQDRLYSALFVYDKIFPNTKVYFGKYAVMTNQSYKNVSFHLDHNEVSIHPILETEKVH